VATPKDGLQDGKASSTSSRLLLGPPTQSVNSALPSGLARCCSLAASFSSDADAASAGKQALCAGAQRSAYLAKADRKLTGPTMNKELCRFSHLKFTLHHCAVALGVKANDCNACMLMLLIQLMCQSQYPI